MPPPPIARRALAAAQPLALAAVDVLVAAAVVAAAVLMRPPGAGVAVWVPAALVGTPLAVRRRWPVPVLGAVLAAGAVGLFGGVRPEPVVYAVAYALYPVALRSARAGAWALAVAVAGVVGPGLVDAAVADLPVHPVDDPHSESFSATPASATAFCVVVLGGSWALARVLAARRRHADQFARSLTARAVAEERLRIARDVHDVVGHNLSLIATRAAVATHLGTGRDDALRTIEEVSRTALADVRLVLDGVRDDDPPSITNLDRLVEQTRAAGVEVTVERGDLSAVPAAVVASAYRIVQEALTNVRRHAPSSRCRVTVAVAGGALAVAVVDDGAGCAPRPAGRPGHGLLGMRERVALHGGTLSAGPLADGGFAVRATLPVPA
ncbi:sensor histidine kinase [Virgisporangium ochraceum]|uniref:sensor histidine kinase n=1 Tax=Virgisporangium ochraceum TaxID=65505 RepID=UPI0019423C18|nr:histidine kinase [Virgisporangium ochraceum]